MKDSACLRAATTAALLVDATSPMGPPRRPVSSRRSGVAAALSALGILMAACGGGGGGGGDAQPGPPPGPVPAPAPAPAIATAAIAVTVLDGALSNALVCLDKNDNDTCDGAEPMARTDAAGHATLVADTADAGKFPVLAMVGTDAVDADHGRVPTAYVMKAPADRAALVTPLTTMVQALIENTGLPTDQADTLLRDQLGLPGTLLRDYSSKTTRDDVKLLALARLLVLSTQELSGRWQAAVGSPVPGSSPVATADLHRLARARLLEELSWVDAQVGSAAVLPALASKDAKQIDTALATRVAAVWRMVGANAADVPAIVGVARAIKASPGTTSPGGWFTALSATSGQTWNTAFSTFTAAGNTGATTFTQQRVSARNGVLKTQGTGELARLWWSGTAWMPCLPATASQRSAPDAAGRTLSSVCNEAWREVHSRAEVDLSGQRIVDVWQSLATTNYGKFWTVDPVKAGAAVFPQGSRIAYSIQVYDRSTPGYTPRRGNVAVLAPAALASGSGAACSAVAAQSPALAWGTEAMTLEGVVAANPGTPCVFAPDSMDATRNEWWDATTVSLGKASADPQQDASNPAYSHERLLRAAFSAGGNVTYYACRESFTDRTARNCEAIGTGSATISTLGDARVMAFEGLPFDRALGGQTSPSGTLASMAHPVLVERGGKVYLGLRAASTMVSRSDLNTQAANAVLALDGIAPIDPSVALAPTAASYQGEWLFWETGTDYAIGASKSLSITSTVTLGSTQSGFTCNSYTAGVPDGSFACTLALDAATGEATISMSTGTANVRLDPATGSVTGVFTPTGASPTPVTGSLR